jgi:hypothetical protein
VTFALAKNPLDADNMPPCTKAGHARWHAPPVGQVHVARCSFTVQRDKGVREMKTMTGIVLMGLALAFTGCNSETAHDQAKDKAVKSHADADRTQAGVDNFRPQGDKAVNQAAEKAQGAIVAAQFTVDKAAADAHAVTADAARSAATVTANAERSAATVMTDAERAAADADRLKNDAARSGQDVLNNANRDLNVFRNAVR